MFQKRNQENRNTNVRNKNHELFNSFTKKLRKNKRSLVLLFFLVITLAITIGTSYSLFQKRDVVREFSIVVGDLTFQLESNAFDEEGKIKVEPHSVKEFFVSITSMNLVDTLYQLYYEELANEEVEIAYYILPGNDSSSGEIEGGGKRQVKIRIENNSSEEATVKIGIQGGLPNNVIELEEGKVPLNETYDGVEVMFDADGGVVDPATKTYHYGMSYQDLPTPTREGYDFVGWYTKEGTLVTNDSTVTILSDGTLYARWNRCSYTLSVDAQGGTWEGSTAVQNFILEYEEEKTIANPTREGYTFKGWSVSGKGSKMDANTFTMGSEDAKLTANWEINTYTLTVDMNGGSWENETTAQKFPLKYHETMTIANPTREGYTFTGWSVSGEGSTLEETTFRMGAADAKLTANWKVNQYPWISYHYKQNIGGSGYTLVDADTGRGEADFGIQVTPPVLTYPGFTSPESQTITIQVDTETPTKNKVDYHYSRNQYTLTVNPNGGIYNDSDTNTTYNMYYEETKTIENPTRTGYTFTSWTRTNGSMTDKVFKMGAEAASLTANWKANTYVVTFNPNGGTTTTTSKNVTYDGTYGTLPTPTRTGYRFDGWFTASSGGSQVTASTKVTITGNQTLFAHWTQTDLSGPSVTVTQPTSTNSSSPTYTTSSSYAVKGTVSDSSGVKSVTVNGKAATLSGSNWSYNLTLSANTRTTVTIVATDTLGNTSTQTRYVYYDSANPSLSVTAPTGTSSSSPTYYQSDSTITYTVKGTVSDSGSGIKSVTVNGKAATVSGTSFSLNVSLATNKVHTITVVATDKAGRTVTVNRYIRVEAYYNQALRAAGNATLVASLDTFLKNSSYCNTVAGNSTAYNIMKSHYKSQMTSYIDSNWNSGLNLLNYRVGFKTYVIRSGSIQTNIWNANYTVASHTSTSGISFTYENQVYPYDNYDRYVNTRYPPLASGSINGNAVVLMDDQQYYTNVGQFNTPINITNYKGGKIQINWIDDGKDGMHSGEATRNTIGIATSKTSMRNDKSAGGSYKDKMYVGGSYFKTSNNTSGTSSLTLPTSTNSVYLQYRRFLDSAGIIHAALIPK